MLAEVQTFHGYAVRVRSRTAPCNPLGRQPTIDLRSLAIRTRRATRTLIPGTAALCPQIAAQSEYRLLIRLVECGSLHKHLAGLSCESLRPRRSVERSL